MTTPIQLVPLGKAQWTDGDGNPLVGGNVYFYVPGTTTPKTTWQDQGGTTPNLNPVPLNARGEAIVWGQGTYRQMVYDVNGNLIYDVVTDTPMSEAALGNITGVGGASLVGFDGTTLDQILMLRLNRVVDSIAALRSLSKLLYARAFVTGYYFPHGGGGGNYQLDPADTTSLDNGGTIIVASDGGRWKLQLITPVTVQQFGAYGDGTSSSPHDDTSAFNAACAAMPAGDTILVPSLTYVVSGTITAQNGQQLIGDAANYAILKRTTDYGDTLYFPNAGAARVDGIWFEHSPFYTAGQTSLTNLVTSGAHVHMINGQEARIENCYMWRMKYGIELDGCTITTIRNNWIQGVWDEQNAGCQEGIANIWLNNASQNCQIIKIVDNYLTGAKSASRNLTWTAGDGSTTAAAVENIGSQYGVLIFSCEDLLVHQNFIGANQAAGIMANLTAGSASLDWRISANFFDDGPTHGQSINFTSPSNSYVNGCTIHGNVFNGELVGYQAIQEYSAGTSGAGPALVNFSIVGNTFQANVGTPISLFGAVNGVITGNTITGYNCRGTSAGADATYCAGVHLSGSSSYIHVHGNNIGGAVGSGGTFGANTHLDVVNDGSNAGLNSVHDNLLIAVGSASNQIGLGSKSTPLTSTANYQATATDNICVMAMVRTTSWAFGLPLNPSPWRTISLKDGVGQAATFGVEVVGVVDGVTNPNYTTNYFSKTFQWNPVANQWNVIAN